MVAGSRIASLFWVVLLVAVVLPQSAEAAPPPPTGAYPGSTDPNNPAAVGSLTPTLSWTASPGAAGYYLNMRRMSDNVLFITERYTGASTTYTMPSGDLASGTTYKWAVEAGDSSGAKSAQSTPVYFTTPNSPSLPNPPTNLSPGSVDQSSAPTVGSVRPTLTWSASNGATHYLLNVRRMSDNVLIIAERNVGASTSYTMPAGDLASGTTYKWAVEAANNAGASPQSTPVYFTTPSAQSVPNPPTNLAPGSSQQSSAPVVGSLTPTLTWSASSGATHYLLNVRRMSDNVLFIAERNVGAQTSYTMPAGDLASGTTYKWAVEAANAAGTSPQSTPVYFTTPSAQSVPNPPTDLAPGSSQQSSAPVVGSLTPTLTWTASSGATHYLLNVRRMSDNVLIITERNVGGSTAYTMPAGDLASGTTYKWSVESASTAGASPQATPVYFTTPSAQSAPNPPTNLSPGSVDPSSAPMTGGVTPTLTWSASNGATHYLLNVRRMSDNVLIITERNVGGSTTYTMPAGDLASGTMYKWAVEAANAAGTSVQSTPVYFVTPGTSTTSTSSSQALAPPSQTAPGSSSIDVAPIVDSLTPTLTWSPASGATSYYLNVRRMSDDALFILERHVGSGTSYAIPAGDLVAGETYKWAIESGNGASKSPQSTPLYFRTPTSQTSSTTTAGAPELRITSVAVYSANYGGEIRATIHYENRGSAPSPAGNYKLNWFLDERHSGAQMDGTWSSAFLAMDIADRIAGGDRDTLHLSAYGGEISVPLRETPAGGAGLVQDVKFEVPELFELLTVRNIANLDLIPAYAANLFSVHGAGGPGGLGGGAESFLAWTSALGAVWNLTWGCIADLAWKVLGTLIVGYRYLDEFLSGPEPGRMSLQAYEVLVKSGIESGRNTIDLAKHTIPALVVAFEQLTRLGDVKAAADFLYTRVLPILQELAAGILEGVGDFVLGQLMDLVWGTLGCLGPLLATGLMWAFEIIVRLGQLAWNWFDHVVIRSPMDVLVTDTQGAMWGVWNGQVIQDASGGLVITHDNEKLVLLAPGNVKSLELQGTGNGVTHLTTNAALSTSTTWVIETTPALTATADQISLSQGRINVQGIPLQGEATPIAVETNPPELLATHSTTDTSSSPGTSGIEPAWPEPAEPPRTPSGPYGIPAMNAVLTLLVLALGLAIMRRRLP